MVSHKNIIPISSLYSINVDHCPYCKQLLVEEVKNSYTTYKNLYLTYIVFYKYCYTCNISFYEKIK